MSTLKPSLFYLLYNRRIVSPERLRAALWYQLGRPWLDTQSFADVLLAFNDLTPLELREIRENWGPELDEEPIGQLLLDNDCINLAQLLKAQAMQQELPNVYLGHILIHLGYTYREELEYFHKKPLFKRPHAPLEQKSARSKALEIFRKRLWMRGYLSLDEIAQLQLDHCDSLPLSFKPLADLLVLNGDLPDTLVDLMCLTPIPQHSEPLLSLLICQGYPPDVLLPKLAKCMTPGDEDKNLAVLLAEKGLISRQRLNTLILEAYRAILPNTLPKAQGA